MLAAAIHAGSEPPIHDSLRLVGAALLKGESAEGLKFQGEFTVAPRKKLPSSVAVYLKSTKTIDPLNPKIEKAAAEILRALGPEAKRQTAQDPALLAEAVDAFVDAHLEVAAPEGEEIRLYAIDARLVEPRASEILKRAWASVEGAGRLRLRIALLRALGVPARECWFRGGLGLQYWAAYLGDDGGLKLKGEWILDETCFAGEAVDAWAMDAGGLSLATWDPAQELQMVSQVTRAYYGMGEAQQAQADLDDVKNHGCLSREALRRRVAPRPGRSGQATPWIMLALHEVSFTAEGPMAYISPMEWLTPYVPHFKSWGEEAHPQSGALELLAQGYWSNRPERVRAKGSVARDDWKSPPPALGMLHYDMVNLRRPASVLEAKVQGTRLSGKLLRADSLAPRAHAELQVEFRPGPLALKKIKSDANGEFSVELKPEELRSRWIYVCGGTEARDPSRWDGLLLGPNY
jgi:hypothetical protein